MPNLIRNKLFTEVALETTKDSIQYVRPFFSKTANGHDLNDRDSTYGSENLSDPDFDPWEYEKGGDFNQDKETISPDKNLSNCWEFSYEIISSEVLKQQNKHAKKNSGLEQAAIFVFKYLIKMKDLSSHCQI